jgi:AcrR family transcriptional regulator
MPPRPYELGRRRASSDATRRQILDAARALIGGKGDLDRFSMEAVAERAGVARMTVYYQFKSRTGLLDALADHLAELGGMHRLRESFQEPDPVRAVRSFVRTFVEFWAFDRMTMRRLRAMGIVYPARYARPRGRDEWRREAATHLVAKIDTGGKPTGTRSREERADLLAMLTSFESFDALYREDRAMETVVDILSTLALAALGLVATESVRKR